VLIKIGIYVLSPTGSTVTTIATVIMPGEGECSRNNQDSFVEYKKGTLPIVLSCPHGGDMRPLCIPDRMESIPSVKVKQDSYTADLTKKIAREIFHRTGGTPYIVLNNVHRKKLEVNREFNRGDYKQGNLYYAENTYCRYHDALKEACKHANILIDIHGCKDQKGIHPRIVVGHGLKWKDLNKKLKDDAWIRGKDSIGALLEEQGLDAEPSPTHALPESSNYNGLSGGYITRTMNGRHVSRAFQLEFPRTMRDHWYNTSPKVAEAIVELLDRWL